MPRRPGADEAGAIHLALNRGNARQTIFRVVLRPREDGAMSRLLYWVAMTRAARHHAAIARTITADESMPRGIKPARLDDRP